MNEFAEQIRQYAEDWVNNYEPWLLWECRVVGGKWTPLNRHPFWESGIEYRRKLKTIEVIINGEEMEFPKPVAKNAISGDKIYTVYFDRIDNKFRVGSDDTESIGGLELAYINGNLCHLSSEAAQAHADVLNAICRGATD